MTSGDVDDDVFTDDTVNASLRSLSHKTFNCSVTLTHECHLSPSRETSV